jgi:hypothetical protein
MSVDFEAEGVSLQAGKFLLKARVVGLRVPVSLCLILLIVGAIWHFLTH